MRLAVLDEPDTWTRRTPAENVAPRAADRTTPAPERVASPWQAQIDRYLAGWAEADPIKIIAATAPGYRLDDPFVGLFTRWSLPQYFDALQARLAASGPLVPRDLAFVLHGPMDHSSSRLGLKFWREAPRLGLTGVATIQAGERGVIAETTAYDLNLASDLLRRV
jgi:hypothetical protein